VTMKLFYSPGSVSLACHIALAEVGADYEAVRLDFSKDEQRKPEYLAINPKGRVPALVTERGILTEALAILAYIAQAYPQAKLAPLDDPYAFAQVQAFNAYLATTVHVAHAHRMRGYRWANEEASFADMRGKVAQNMAECFELIGAEYFKGPWVMGDQYTICDPYLFRLAGWLEGDGVEMARFPWLVKHFEAMRARPATRRAHEEQGLPV